MKDRRNVPNLDMLQMYDQDGLRQLVFVARETLVEPEYQKQFLH
jgi:hypothetical protein